MACADEAYASLLSVHSSHVGTRTFLADPGHAHHGGAKQAAAKRFDPSFYLGRDGDLHTRQVQLLLALVRSLRRAGIGFVDVQFVTEHLRSLGASEVSREEYLGLVAVQRDREVDLTELVPTVGPEVGL